MASYDYYHDTSPNQPNLNAPLPPLPTSSPDFLSQPPSSAKPISPITPFDDEAYPAQRYSYFDTIQDDQLRTMGHDRDPFTDDDAIPLQHQYPKNDQLPPLPHEPQYQYTPQQQEDRQKARHKSRKKSKKREPFFSLQRPWVVYILTFVQVTVFIATVIRNAVLTGSPIEIHPQFNPMIGPSFYVLINMGARYVPCMRTEPGIQNSNAPILWPCPNQTDTTPTCSLSELCGFNGVPNPHVGGNINETPAPDQWYRFIIPIFLHAGLIHITFNMLLQWLLGRDMERTIGHVRFTVVYFAAGIFGFIMGGNFAPAGIASTGASGSLYGVIALTLLDLLYNWPERKSPWKDLLFIFLDIAISFVLGLLPGVDNFSHIGGFLMGLALGLCLLRSPIWLRRRTGTASPSSSSSIDATDPAYNASEPKSSSSKRHHDSSRRREKHDRRSSLTTFLRSPRTFFLNRKPLWWAWWLVRAAAVVGAILCFIFLLRNFYTYRDTCSWCKYLSCIDVKNWCDIGNLTFQQQKTPARRGLAWG